MYEYTPKTQKKKEFLIVAILSVAAAFLFCCSTLPSCLYPSLWQLTCVFLLVAVIMLVSKCLLRSFVYRVAPREDVEGDAPPDFTVTECYGKRSAVVCRISVADIEAVTPVTPQNRKALAAMGKGKSVYRYFSELSPQNLCWLTVRDGDNLFYIRIVADENLISALQKN
ncbi:MAG: hypothetical protein IJW55_00580 [Clostridia bacterium]|nr:hypothetical protein [Clostridia bacterium]